MVAAVRAAAVAIFLACAWGSAAEARSLTVDIGRLTHPQLRAEELQMRLDGAGGAQLRAARLAVEAQAVDAVALECAHLSLVDDRLRCVDGRLEAAGMLLGDALQLAADLARQDLRVDARLAGGGQLTVEVAEAARLRARLEALPLAAVHAYWPQLAQWQVSGSVDGGLELSAAAAQWSVQVRELAFGSADGLQAAEGVALSLQGGGEAAAQGWHWRGALAWTAGEAYLHPLYLTAGARSSANGRMVDGVLHVDALSAHLEGVERIDARGRYDLRAQVLEELALSVSMADLAVIGPRYLAPVLLPAQADGLIFAGHASGGVVIEHGELQAIDLAVDAAGLSLADGALAFGPVSGALPWRAALPTRIVLDVGGGRWQKLALGAFTVDASAHGGEVVLEALRIPLLDGALAFSDLRLQRREDGWHGGGSVVVEPIAMPLLSVALGMPEMAGVLSASLPGLRVDPGEIVLDGALVVSVFDGYLMVTGLRVREPFGVASHLVADIDARNIDLAQLTETFSFGSVSGHVDAHLLGLELVRWRPVRFDARVASSPGRYPRRISQRAVQNIGALGGAGAMAAIQRSLLGFFDSFGYREIGLSCVLRAGVCVMGGLDQRPGGGYALVRGGGIPALNVIGYNRRVDWHELVDRLQRVIASNAAPEIR